MKEMLDIIYREIDGTTLCLDLFLPGKASLAENAGLAPLIFYIHGGAWLEGSRKNCWYLKNQAERGYAVASIDYRLTAVAPFPACIADCKHALAFLRKNAKQYSIDASRVCVSGDSAGGHLAALMGVTAGHCDWEPEGGDCSVQAVIDFYGPVVLKEMVPPDFEGRNGVLDPLLGAPLKSPKGLMAAAGANPISYIKGKEPPFLIIHGDKDDIVPIGQSYLLRNELEKYNQSVAMHTVFGGGHGFDSPAAEAVINAFLDCHIMQQWP
jgi:acetyl esterase/lipase